jgi:palmitoyltransferase ZDHHC9/14/18
LFVCFIVVVVSIFHYLCTNLQLSVYRAKFCRETNNCVENFDHYCPWVGNAIGIRNYHNFVAFVSLCVVLVIYSNVASWISIIDNMDGSGWDAFTKSLRHRIVEVIMILYTIIIGVSLAPLFGFHAWLIGRNQTTNENLKGTWSDISNPNDRGYLRNYSAFCVQSCVERPSYVASTRMCTSMAGGPSAEIV